METSRYIWYDKYIPELKIPIRPPFLGTGELNELSDIDCSVYLIYKPMNIRLKNKYLYKFCFWKFH